MSDATITIFHNPACGTSRNTLALIRNSGVDRSSSITSRPHRAGPGSSS